MEWYFFVLISAALFSFYYIILKVNLHHKHVPDYLFIYSLFALAAALPLYKFVQALQPLQYILIYADALMLTLFFITLTYAYKHLELSEISPLSNLTLVLTVVGGLVLFHERLRIVNIIGILLIVTGAYILEVGIKLDKIKRLVAHIRTKYVRLALVSSVFSASSLLLDKIILEPSAIGLDIIPTNVFTLQVFTRLFIAVNMAVFVIIKSRSFDGVTHAIRTSSFMIFLAAIAYTLGNLAYYKAMSVQYAALVVPLLSLSSLMTTIIGGELFHEHNLAQKVVATLIMIAGTYFVVI